MSKQPDNTLTDPLQEWIRWQIEDRCQKFDDHATLRACQPYKAAIKQFDRLAMDYGLAITAINVTSARWPPFRQRLITLRVTQHLVESLAAVICLVNEGALNPARRELRFLVEASVKTLWLDQDGPKIGDTRSDQTNGRKLTDVAMKVAALDSLGEKRFAEIVASLWFKMLDERGARMYRQTATDLYSKLSTFNHITSGNVEHDLADFERGRAFGLETVANINTIARLTKRVLDLALASHFEAFDSGLVGDIFVHGLDDRPHWTFRKTTLVGAIDRHFDYKWERKRS